MLEIKRGHLTWVGPKQGLTVSIPDKCILSYLGLFTMSRTESKKF